MKKVNGIKILIRNLIIGSLFFLLLAGFIARIMYTIFAISYHDNQLKTYQGLKEEFKINSTYDNHMLPSRTVSDEELLNELTFFLCSMADADSFDSIYNYGCIIDADTGKIVRDTKRAYFAFNDNEIDPENATLKEAAAGCPIYWINTNNINADPIKYAPGTSYSCGTMENFNAENFTSCKDMYITSRNDIKYMGDLPSSYKISSNYLTTIFHPVTEFSFFDSVDTAEHTKLYYIYYYSLNKNWATKGLAPFSTTSDINMNNYINDLCKYDTTTDDFVYITNEEGETFAAVMKDGKITYYGETTEIVNVNKVLVDFILRILLITIMTIVFVATILEYFKKKSTYNQYQYRKVLMDSMAHDLKSPLMSMSGYAENLKENVHTEKREYYADSIINNIQYLNKIINDDLEISRLDSMNKKLEKEDCDFITLLEEKLDHYQNDIDTKKISVEVSGTFPLQADVNMMGIVAENLITNCIHYCNENGVIEIKNERKHLIISNTTDIPYKGHLKELWEPFIKGDTSRSGRNGTGLGLAIVSKILDRHKLKYKLSYNQNEKKFACRIRK